MLTQSLNLHELTTLAREYAKPLRTVDRRRLHVMTGPCPSCGKAHAHICFPPEPTLKIQRICNQLMKKKLLTKQQFKHYFVYGHVFIVIESYNLTMPRRLQEWLIAHEVAHLYTAKSHRTRQFRMAEQRLIPDTKQRYMEYYAYLGKHMNRKRRR